MSTTALQQLPGNMFANPLSLSSWLSPLCAYNPQVAVRVSLQNSR